MAVSYPFEQSGNLPRYVLQPDYKPRKSKSLACTTLTTKYSFMSLIVPFSRSLNHPPASNSCCTRCPLSLLRIAGIPFDFFLVCISGTPFETDLSAAVVAAMWEAVLTRTVLDDGQECRVSSMVVIK